MVIEVFGIEHDEPIDFAELADELAVIVAERLDVALAERALIARVIAVRGFRRTGRASLFPEYCHLNDCPRSRFQYL